MQNNSKQYEEPELELKPPIFYPTTPLGETKSIEFAHAQEIEKTTYNFINLREEALAVFDEIRPYLKTNLLDPSGKTPISNFLSSLPNYSDTKTLTLETFLKLHQKFGATIFTTFLINAIFHAS